MRDSVFVSWFHTLLSRAGEEDNIFLSPANQPVYVLWQIIIMQQQWSHGGRHSGRFAASGACFADRIVQSFSVILLLLRCCTRGDMNGLSVRFHFYEPYASVPRLHFVQASTCLEKERRTVKPLSPAEQTDCSRLIPNSGSDHQFLLSISGPSDTSSFWIGKAQLFPLMHQCIAPYRSHALLPGVGTADMHLAKRSDVFNRRIRSDVLHGKEKV